jgi:hypothetical protein
MVASPNANAALVGSVANVVTGTAGWLAKAIEIEIEGLSWVPVGAVAR